MNRLRTLKSLVPAQEGLALTEFAMALPVLLTLGLFGMETANLAMAHLRVSNIAMITADGAARVRERIDEADIVQLMTGAKRTGMGIDFADNGRIILSSLERNAAGDGQWIRWQRCDGARSVVSRYGAEDAGRNDASIQAVGPAGNQISAGADTAVMVVEVVYDYQPLFSAALLGTREIRYESAFNVRQRTDQQLYNGGNLPASVQRTCNRFQA